MRVGAAGRSWREARVCMPLPRHPNLPPPFPPPPLTSAPGGCLQEQDCCWAHRAMHHRNRVGRGAQGVDESDCQVRARMGGRCVGVGGWGGVRVGVRGCSAARCIARPAPRFRAARPSPPHPPHPPPLQRRPWGQGLCNLARAVCSPQAPQAHLWCGGQGVWWWWCDGGVGVCGQGARGAAGHGARGRWGRRACVRGCPSCSRSPPLPPKLREPPPRVPTRTHPCPLPCNRRRQVPAAAHVWRQVRWWRAPALPSRHPPPPTRTLRTHTRTPPPPPPSTFILPLLVPHPTLRSALSLKPARSPHAAAAFAHPMRDPSFVVCRGGSNPAPAPPPGTA